MKYPLTRNCTRVANAVLRLHIEAVCRHFGYAFVVEPDGTGLYCDFALDDDDDGFVEARDSFKCVPKQHRASDVTTPANQALSPHSGGIAPPTHPDGAAWALFLDFDGTLVDIAMTPDAVVVSSTLRAVLPACIDAFDEAVAIVSGRPISTLDALLDPLRLPAAGLHGLELRLPDGTVEETAHHTAGLAELRARLHSLVREDARLVVEDKGSSLALHFRRAPEREHELRELVAGAATRQRGHHVMYGKMVLEVRPAHADKGTAVTRFLETSRFAGRVPVFAGDDITDEDGFGVANRLGGISIKVGAGETAASYRVPDVAALHDWLTAIASARRHC